MSNTEDTETDREESAPTLDHSLKVETSSLGADEMDFATAMGFGDDPDPEPDPEPEASAAPERSAEDAPSSSAEADETEAAASAETADPEQTLDAESPDAVAPATAPTEPEDESEEAFAEDADDAVAAQSSLDARDAVGAADPVGVVEAAEVRGALDDPAEPAAAPAAPDRDWEEIHPRPAADGDQTSLLERANEILDDDVAGPDPVAGVAAVVAPGPAADAELQRELDAARASLVVVEQQLADRDLEIERLRGAFESEIGQQAAESKQIEALESQLDALGLERDQLVDQLSVANSRLAETDGRIERLETSLRAARGALIPLPEGERALRAEVLGLRARLDEAAQENVRQASDMASVATELAVATARVEDRQHEIDFHKDRADELEAAAREMEARLTRALAEHKEALALATRLQAENAELKSTQAALEETLQARDLEIAAREEHLRVTRDGLTARDAEIVELNDHLDEERHRSQRLESELSRSAAEQPQWLAKIARREARISELTETLARIEQAMNRGSKNEATPTVVGPDPPAPAS